MRSIAPEVRKRISDAAVLSSANVGTILVYYRRPMRHGHHLLNALRFLVTSAAQQPRSWHGVCLCSHELCIRAAEALGWLQSAIDADPKNPLAKFEKAAVLMSQEQYQPALLELEALKVGALHCPDWATENNFQTEPQKIMSRQSHSTHFSDKTLLLL